MNPFPVERITLRREGNTSREISNDFRMQSPSNNLAVAVVSEAFKVVVSAVKL
jgi:hypothetical protein